MADAPAGGGGWGALEIILAIVLAIGLITTITNTPLGSVIGPAKGSATKTTKVVTANPGCGLIVSLPTKKEQISNAVTVNGYVAQCLNVSAVPDALNAYVVDSTGSVLSAYTTIPINKSFFGDDTFSSVIPLQGVAHSTTAYLVISSPAATNGTSLSARIQLQLLPGNTTVITNQTTVSGGSGTTF